MNSVKPKVLITGANGFVGARLCRKFLTESFQVIAGVRQNADLTNLSGLDINYRYGDIVNPETLSEMVKETDYIIHNAGVTKAKTNSGYFIVNELGTENIFEAIKQHNPQIKKVVYISSLAAGGPSFGKPVIESDEPRPITTYGRSKLAGENKAVSYKDSFPVAAVRPPGVYGPGDKEIFSFFQTLSMRIKPYIGDTSRKIQLVHVDDLCSGVFLAATKNTQSGSVYYIAENRAYSMKELVLTLQKAIGKSAIPLYLPGSLFKVIAQLSKIAFKLVGATPMLTPEKAGELLASWEVSTAKAEKELGFKSEISFENGAKETYEWYKKEGWL